MTTRVARCTCGEWQVRCDGEPKRVSLCHCLDCQRRTGSLFSIAAFYERAKVAVVAGHGTPFKRDSASGKPVTFHFCSRCGSTVMWEPERLSELIGVAVGAFGDPDFPKPQQAVWSAHRHAWLTLPEEMPSYDANPPPRTHAS